MIIGNNNKQKVNFYEEKLPSGVNNLYNFSKYRNNLNKIFLEMMTLDHFCFVNDIVIQVMLVYQGKDQKELRVTPEMLGMMDHKD